MEVEKALIVGKLAQLAESNKELVEKNNQLDKEHKDEVARLTSENTKLKEQVTKLDKDFSSMLSTTQLLIPFSIIHHAQHGLMLECSHAPKCQDTPGGVDKGEGPLDIEVQGNGRRNKARAGPDRHGT
jgi:FtsZ-binding cell division protein ZapB